MLQDLKDIAIGAAVALVFAVMAIGIVHAAEAPVIYPEPRMEPAIELFIDHGDQPFENDAVEC